MLVLKRNSGQSVVVKCAEGEIRITVIPNKGSTSFRMLFEAPRTVEILRSELLKQPAGS